MTKRTGATYLKRTDGFTLIELIATLVIISVLASVAVKKHRSYSDIADLRVIESAVSTLNTYEVNAWCRVQFGDGWTGDTPIFNEVKGKANFGGSYQWTAGPNPTGGSLRYNQTTKALTRTPSTGDKWGLWTI